MIRMIKMNEGECGGMRYHLLPTQKTALLVLVTASLWVIAYHLWGLPLFVFYLSLAFMVGSLIIFLLPMNQMLKRSLHAQEGHKIYSLMAQAGLSDKDMQEIVEVSKLGYKIGFAPTQVSPYYQVVLSRFPVKEGAELREEDYAPWQEVAESVRGSKESASSGKV